MFVASKLSKRATIPVELANTLLKPQQLWTFRAKLQAIFEGTKWVKWTKYPCSCARHAHLKLARR